MLGHSWKQRRSHSAPARNTNVQSTASPNSPQVEAQTPWNTIPHSPS